MKDLGRWLAETRLGRAIFRLAILGFAVAAVGLLIWVEVSLEVGERTKPIIDRVEVIERVEPIDVIRECLRAPRCNYLLANPSSRQQVAEGGDASQPAPTTGQHPAPGKPGGSEGTNPPKGGRGKPKSPKPAATPPPSPLAPPALPVPPPAPGNSGDTPAAGKGTKACVDLIVSACVRAPSLLP